jgi:hypothetical protein
VWIIKGITFRSRTLRAGRSLCELSSQHLPETGSLPLSNVGVSSTVLVAFVRVQSISFADASRPKAIGTAKGNVELVRLIQARARGTCDVRRMITTSVVRSDSYGKSLGDWAFCAFIDVFKMLDS